MIIKIVSELRKRKIKSIKSIFEHNNILSVFPKQGKSFNLTLPIGKRVSIIKICDQIINEVNQRRNRSGDKNNKDTN